MLQLFKVGIMQHTTPRIVECNIRLFYLGPRTKVGRPKFDSQMIETTGTRISRP